MINKVCKKCKLTKPVNEFYNNKTAYDGLQAKCKDCCKEANKQFHQKNPTYYWGSQESYFRKNYDKAIEYQREKSKATNVCKIFRIDLPDGEIYIGSTRRTLSLIRNSIKQDHVRYRKQVNSETSILHKFLIKFPEEKCFELIKSLYLVQEFIGTRTELVAKQIEVIKKLRKQNKTVLFKNLN